MDIRCSKIRRSAVVAEIDRRIGRQQNSKCVFTSGDVTRPRGHVLPACLAAPVVILDNEKTTVILSGMGIRP